MFLETVRFRIRPYSTSDASDALKIYGDWEVVKWLAGDTNLPKVPKDMIPRIENWVHYQNEHPGYGLWAIEAKKECRVVGSVLLKPLPEGGDVEIGWHVGTADWGMGIATESAISVRDYGFEKVGLTRIVAIAYPENTKSIRVMEKLGMECEGMVRQFGLDLIQYACHSG